MTEKDEKEAELEQEKEADRGMLWDVVGVGQPGEKIVITRVWPKWIEGVVEEIEIVPGSDETISWKEIDRRFGGGKYRVTLLKPGHRGIRGSVVVAIPGLPKYQGVFVADENDLIRMKNQNDPTLRLAAPGEETVLANSLKPLVEMMGRMLEQQAKQAQDNAQLVLTAINDLRSKQSDPLVDALKTIGQIQKITGVLSEIGGAAQQTAEAVESLPADPIGGLVGVIAEKAGPVIVDRILAAVLGSPAPGGSPNSERGPSGEPPLSEEEKKSLQG